MATVTYGWTNVRGSFLMDDLFTASVDSQPAIAGLGNRYFAIWSVGNTSSEHLDGRVVDSSGTPLGSEFLVDPIDTRFQFNTSAAELANGNLVIAFADAITGPNNIHARLLNANGAPLGPDIVASIISGDTQPDVAALADGGFVVTWTNHFSQQDLDLAGAIFNADGSVRNGFINIDSLITLATSAPSVAGLAGGNFVVAWEQTPVAGGDSSVWFQRYDANGNPLGAHVLLNNVGSIHRDIQTVGLRDGGFAVAYTDNGYNMGGTEITFEIFNADGSLRIGTRANTETAGNQGHATLTLLFNGDIVAGWSDGDNLVYQAYAPDGTTLGTNFVAATGGVFSDQIAGLDGGFLANVHSTFVPNALGEQVRSSIDALTRTTTSDNTGEAMTGDSLRDIILGNGGNDILDGRGGDDMLDGGAGIDTGIFTGTLASHAINWSGQNITLKSAVDGFDTTHAIEHFQFSDGTVVQDDGNALVDDLYYDSRNIDVWNAHVDADVHYAASGWHEGRNPDLFFSTNGYLSANRDVRAANVNPLDQYHTTGWLQGRDPSAAFDTELYLLHNPDVAAAHLDPLEHFLAQGREEGRQAFSAVGRNITDDFDSEFYLLSNPDVGFAGVDPFAHYSASGFHEGRNPNAFFDTAGYLKAYADVAAAGVNPLEHYHQSGWQEGRDPSGAFDTKAYLAAYPDVAALHIDPLEHFLKFGIYEGRSPFGDGSFHAV